MKIDEYTVKKLDQPQGVNALGFRYGQPQLHCSANGRSSFDPTRGRIEGYGGDPRSR